MWTIFRKIIRTGVVTRDLKKNVVDICFQGPPLIQYTGCTACGRCVEACPSAALIITQDAEKSVLTLDLASCVFCENCVNSCPERVMSVSNRFHWASKIRADLAISGRCGKG